jgi:hypothetical protein
VIWYASPRVEQRPHGPAENAFLFIEPIGDGRRGRYLSWINYFDIEYAAHAETGAWRVVEPARPYDRELAWVPFGWSSPAVPTIGDSILRARG